MYVELHCHSNFSLLDGASHPEDLIARAAELGMPALALTDHNAVYGVPRFVRAAKEHGIRPILGAEMTLETGHHLTLLVENQAGWRNLCYLIQQAQHNAPKGEAALPADALVDHTAGLIALSGCRQGEVASYLLQKNRAAAKAAAKRLCDLFGPDRFWIELQHHLLPDGDIRVADLIRLARHLGLSTVATNNVHYAQRDNQPLQDVLVAIRERSTIEAAEPHLRPNSEFYLKSAQRMAAVFAHIREAIPYDDPLANTLRIAEQCQFALTYGLQDLPIFSTPNNLDVMTYLRHLCEQGIRQRYDQSDDQVCRQMDHELAIINRAGLGNYFLIVWDIVRYAREQGIRCQGRGSAANSLVAYLLDISPVDPLAHDLVFERFLSAERQAIPDIDLDFAADRREEVIQYIYERYGPEHVAMACNIVTFRTRSALRDVARVLSLPEAAIHRAKEALETGAAVTDVTDIDDPVERLLGLARQIKGYPRHLSIHVGGMVLTGPPLSHYVPDEVATMPNRTVVQWDKDGLEAMGLIKVDILGLRMLSALTEAVDLIEQTTGQTIDLDSLTFDDAAVYDMICAADTLGVFQVESRAQAGVLPRLKPRCFTDLVVSISLIRPGPIQGNAVHPYLRRRAGVESVTYLHPLMESALKDTLGVLLFQEDVLKIAHDLAGFSKGHGEQLRRALGAKDAAIEIERLHVAFLAGARAKGVPLDTAEAVFDKLRAFASYSFARSHATAFAVIVYQSAWLKRYYPAAFLCALMNNQPMGFWSPAVLAGDAKRHGIQLLPLDIVRSQAECGLEDGNVRLGFSYVKGFGEAATQRLIDARAVQPFTNLADLCRRSQLPCRLIENLIQAGGLDAWGIPRRTLLWELGQLQYAADPFDLDIPLEAITLPPLTNAERLTMHQNTLGLSPGEHIMALYRPWLQSQGILDGPDLAALSSGHRVRVAGLLVVHQSPPTAKGFHFITIETETSLIDLIIRPKVYTQYRRLLSSVHLLLAEGILQHEDGVTNVVVRRLRQLMQ